MNDLTIPQKKLYEKSEQHIQAEEKTIEDEYFKVLATQSSRVPLPVILMGIIIASLASRDFPAILWGGWFAAMIIILMVRWKVLSQLPDRTDLSTERRVQIALVLSLINGLVHASSLYFFQEFSVAERSIHTLMLAGLMTGAVATTAGHLTTFLAFSMPVTIALTIAWAIFPLPEINTLVRFGIPVLVLFLGLVLTGLAREYSKFFTESFEIRLKQKQLNEQLKNALDDAIAANEAKTRFLASASHDLRQPIHALSLFMGTLMRREHSPETTEIISHLNQAVQNLSTQMNSLLDMSKLDAGLVKPRLEPLDLQAYLEQLRVEFQHEVDEKQLGLELIGTQPAFVMTDTEHFDRILRNLLSNALRYTEKGGIRIELSPEGNDWSIRIRDTGRGIPEREQQLIFEEFYQVDNPHRDRKQGLGLGLAIVRRLTELLEISLALESKENVGTTVTLRLPKYLVRKEAPARGEHPASIAGTNILCIDDEADVRIALQTLLTDLGCKSECAEGTERALEIASQEEPDIVIADLRLAHGDDGITAIDRLRKRYPGLPALLITGDTAPDRLQMISDSDIPLLHKPVSAEELTRAIHNQLHQ